MEALDNLCFDTLGMELANKVCKSKRKTITSMAEWLRLLISEVEQAEEKGLLLVALAGALIIPDLCGHIEYPDERIRSRKKYIDWTRNFIYPIIDKCLDEGSMKTGYENLLYQQAYLYQLRCFVFHEGVPGLNEKDIAQKKSCNEYSVSDFKFTLILDDEVWTGTSGYGEYSKIEESTSKTERKVEITVSANEVCHVICTAARNYLNENEEKFAKVDGLKVIDNRRKEGVDKP